MRHSDLYYSCSYHLVELKIVLSFPSLGQTELTNETLSIEDKRFNG